MIGFFKSTFWYIIKKTPDILLKYVPGVQEACDEVVTQHYRPLLEMHLILPMSGIFFFPNQLQQGSGHRTVLFTACP